MPHGVSYIFPALLLCGATPLYAQLQERMVIGSGVVCRSEPERTAPVRYIYRIGDIVGASEQTVRNGETWYMDRLRVSGQYPSCWIYGPLTVEFRRSEPVAALAAAADHALRRTDASFEDLVSVDNLFTQGLSGEDFLSTSGLLQYRRLEILRRIAKDFGDNARDISRDPLKLSWFLAHRDVIRYYEPDNGYFVPVAAYWALHDKFPNEPWSEELAWTAAQIHIPSDECYSDCVFRKIEQTYARYWQSHPTGGSVKEAIDRAVPMARYAVEMSLYDESPLALLTRLRRSLDKVSASNKTWFLSILDDAEKKYAPR